MFWVVIINRSTYDVKNMGWERILHLKFTVISNLELNYGFLLNIVISMREITSISYLYYTCYFFWYSRWLSKGQVVVVQKSRDSTFLG